MAVQAQYPSNILLLNRNVQDSKNSIILGNNDQPQPGGGFLEQSHMFFNHNGGGVNPRKRSREAATTATPTSTTVNSFNFSLQNQQQTQNQSIQLIDLSQLHNQQQQQQQQQQQHTSVVSTGLRLSFGDQTQQQQHQKQQENQQQIQQQHPTLLSLVSEELAFQYKQQSDDLNYFLHAQGEQLRHTLAEKRQQHYRALMTVARRVREKEAEVEAAARRNVELEARAAQLSAEAQAWQLKARAQEAQAVSLQAQLQQAMVGPNNVGGALQQDREGSGLHCVGDTDDAESAYVDPVSERRVSSPSCKACRTRAASVVLLPCRHLSVCVQCDDLVQACPVCFSLRSASVEVYLT